MAAPQTVDELNDVPIKTVGNATIYLRDVATVSDGFAPQTNIVRAERRRGVLLSIIKAGNASTISVVNGDSRAAAAGGTDAAAATEDRAARRPVDLRQGAVSRRHSRGGDRRRASRR